MKSRTLILSILTAAAPAACAQLVNDGETKILGNVTNFFASPVTIGTNGSFTLLVLSDHCLVTNTGIGQIGQNAAARSNEVRLVSATARWQMLNPLSVGVDGAFNRLTVSNGASVLCSQGAVGNASGPSNSAVIVGPGSSWSMTTDLIIGSLGGGNRLEVRDGASVANENGQIGGLSSGNEALVAGAGSVWNTRSVLYVGLLANANRLVVSNGGVATASNVIVGFTASSAGNRIVVNGGELRVTNSTGTGMLDVRRGTNLLSAGSVAVDQLVVTNTLGRMEIKGGTLSVKNSRFNNGTALVIGDGLMPAAFHLAGNGSHVLANGLTISANAALTGNGRIGGGGFLTVSSGGTLSPGDSIGRVVLSNTPSLHGSVLMEISKTGSTTTNDRIEARGVLALITMAYGGSLTVTNIGPDALTAGDRFQLFNAGGYIGAFDSVALPPLGPLLNWTNKLSQDGSVEIYSTAFAETGLKLPGLWRSSVAWGDYDNDGRLDLLLTGTTNGFDGYAEVWRNTGSGFTNIHAGLTGVLDSSVAWGDFDNDGRLDILLTGATNSVVEGPVAQVWRNTGSGFTNINAGLPGVFFSSAAWGDFDNDGRLDILLTGSTTGFPNYTGTCQLWRNTGAGFVNSRVALPALYRGSVACGDYDNDGRLDLLLTGTTNDAGGFSQVWRNTGDGFTNINAGLPGVWLSSVAWADYDNDGLLDILLSGYNGSVYISQVLRNTGAGFTNISAGIPGLPGMGNGSVAWGDYDNDGNRDIVLAGYNGSQSICQIWRNNGNRFLLETNALLPGLMFADAAWGDADNDGRLDLFLTGYTGSAGLSQIWRNLEPASNSPPAAPSALSVTLDGSTVTLSWKPAFDDHTPVTGLTYNVRVGTNAGGTTVLNPMSAGGWLRIPAPGNAQLAQLKRLTLPAGQPFYWSVQAVDSAFAGSAFAPESSFTFNSVFTPPDGIPVPGDVDGNGIVSESELDSVLANYWSHSPFLQMTNVAGLGGSNVTFALNPSLAGAFSVEYTTNLADWNFLGPATPRYEFTDTNAPTELQRYYRLRWP